MAEFVVVSSKMSKQTKLGFKVLVSNVLESNSPVNEDESGSEIEVQNEVEEDIEETFTGPGGESILLRPQDLEVTVYL